ncbi:uridine kinase family protein [Saliterribacillus persicus]|uniref:Uridine kinase n=1 Tax=Saliterribacillus persicus TaxID=930114 RepID=A0A368Y9M5_9BACI|nr:phosphoribulokinase [Saliterribacillus persicus]RCW76815.1 uridine kinase [Saliterribacillus persicus]
MDKILNKIARFASSKKRKIIIGISGHGASGKTTFANNLIKLLGHSDVNYINTDPYIIGSSNIRNYSMINYEYKNENHQGKMTACHPGAHNIQALERDIHMIRDGLDIYTIGTHYKKSNLISSKNNVNIIEGMSVAFANPNLLDLKVYLYTDGETEFTRRSYRDVAERGRNIDFLRQSHEERRIQYELFMHPYHRNFNIVLKNSDEEYFLEKDDLI